MQISKLDRVWATAAAPRGTGLQAERGIPLGLDQASDASDVAHRCERDEIGFHGCALSIGAWATMPQSRGSASASSWTKAASSRWRPGSTAASAKTILS